MSSLSTVIPLTITLWILALLTVASPVKGQALKKTIPEHIREFTCGKLYYRTFYVDAKKDIIYIGAMNRLFKVNLSNVNRSRCDADSLVVAPHSDAVKNCVNKGKPEQYDCHNHIRVIQPIGDGSKMYVCGTYAHDPRDFVFQVNQTHMNVVNYPGTGNGAAKCPFDPEDNATAVWVERGNPGGLSGLYSGTVAEFSKADTVIFRTSLYNLNNNDTPAFQFKRTVKYDSKWLDKPQFAGSFDIGEFVFFFFRESAVEYINCGKNIYSRVARICKSDVGGRNILSTNWASYLKARLNCSIPGEFPFYFNEIQNVYKHPDNEKKFYAIFTTNTNGLVGSAICTYSLDSIQKVFNGKFKEQAGSSSAWLPIPNNKVPEPRPGLCVNDTQTLPDSVLNFIRGHPLMDSAVTHDNEKPVFYKKDVIFLKLVVENIEVEGIPYTIYYVGTNEGYVYKLVEWFSNGVEHSNLVDIFEATTPEPIRAMDISSKHKSLYVGSDQSVRQFNLVMCKARYENCLQCIQDPYCGWDKDRNECKAFVTGLLQDVTNATPGICDNSVKNKPLRVYWGQSVHLACPVHIPDLDILGVGNLRWYHYTREKGKYEVQQRKDKYIYTSDHGLVIMSITERDSGRYDCKLGTSTLCSYNITVDTKTCSAPTEADYRKIYSDWCHEFEKYKAAMKTWQNKQAKCQGAHPNDVTYQGNPAL